VLTCFTGVFLLYLLLPTRLFLTVLFLTGLVLTVSAIAYPTCFLLYYFLLELFSLYLLLPTRLFLAVLFLTGLVLTVSAIAYPTFSSCTVIYRPCFCRLQPRPKKSKFDLTKEDMHGSFFPFLTLPFSFLSCNSYFPLFCFLF
jgi:hypothetical protein